MNVVYIHTHDSGRMLRPYGYDIPTPNLMTFAREALVFRQAYCAGPTCSPSRAALLTGMYPHCNGMLGLAQRGFALYDYNRHLTSYLKKFSYKTVLCGIQHEAGSFLNHAAGAKQIGYDEDISADNTGMREEDLVLWDWQNAANAADWLRQHGREGAFFLSHGMFATHRKYPEADETIEAGYTRPPYPATDTAGNREDHARYLTSAQWFDRCFGHVIDALKEAGLYENTIIISTTDHGLALPFSKCTLFDTGIGVSLIMRVPGAAANGNVCDTLVSHIDIFPTLCDLLGLSKPEWLQGESFAALFSNSSDDHREEIFAEINFHTSYEPARCIRTQRYKYIRYFDSEYQHINISNIDNSPPKSFLLSNDLVEQKKAGEALYDLYYDPGERCNLIHNDSYTVIADKLRRQLRQWMEKTDDPLLSGAISLRPEWKVNRKTCINPSSKEKKDYENLPSNQ